MKLFRDQASGRVYAYEPDGSQDELIKPEFVALSRSEAAAHFSAHALTLDKVRRAEVLAELAAIDAASARPLRAILVGSATDEDRQRLAELDAQAATLRAELDALTDTE